MKEPFRSYTLDEDKNPLDITFTLRITPTERVWFEEAKKFIKQPKNSTAIKQLAEIGAANVLHDKKTNTILDIILNNFRRNARIGIAESDYKIKKNLANVTQNEGQM